MTVMPEQDTPGQIMTHEHLDPQGFRYLTYSWEGGPLTEITRSLTRSADPTVVRGPSRPWRTGDIIWIGPYRLMIVGYPTDRLGRYYTARRMDGLLDLLWVAGHWAGLAWKWWSDRAILTLAVWGLAYPDIVSPEPSVGLWDCRWGHVYAVAWIRRVFTKVQHLVDGVIGRRIRRM